MDFILGKITAPPVDEAKVPCIINLEECVEDIKSVIETDLKLLAVLEGPNVLSFVRAVENGYRVEFESSGCPSGEIAKLIFQTPEKPGAHLLKITSASFRLAGGKVITPNTTNGKVLVKA